MGRTACTESQCLYKGALYFYLFIYNYKPETNRVPRDYSVAASLLLQFMVYVMLFPTINASYFFNSTSRSKCTVLNMAVSCSSLTSCFPGMLLKNFLNYFRMVPVAPIITAIAFVFTFHMRCASIVNTVYFRISSGSFLTTFCLLKLQHKLTYIFLLHYLGL